MEKRLLLAFALSFLFLYTWSAISPQPAKKKESVAETQLIANKENTSKPAESQEKPDLSSPPPVAPLAQEEKRIIENEKIQVEISNYGAKITKIVIKEFNIALPVADFLKIGDYAAVPFILEEASPNNIRYAIEDKGEKIIRQYSLSGEEYILDAETEIINKRKMSKEEMVDIDAFSLDISRLDKKTEASRDKSLLEYSVSSNRNIFRKANAFKFNKKEETDKKGSVDWIGFRDRYFCTIVKPLFETRGYTSRVLDEKTLQIVIKPEEEELEIPTNEHIKFAFKVFYGPQKLDLLQSYDLGFENIMKFSNWNILDAISKTIYNIMNGMHKIIPSWGVCIILISLIIYGIMYPLTMKGMSSMKKMQSLQPKINQIREQHKNNPQKLNKEIMELYKEHKINPLGGCLPLILQMPIFIGLYQVLWRSVAFKGSKFLWINDLSEPDRLFILPYSLPVIGNEINILPIIMIVVMVFQQKISAKNMVITDPNQANQQKIMMTVFPIFIGFIFYKFASGLCLYFTVFYILSTFTQWKISRMAKVA